MHSVSSSDAPMLTHSTDIELKAFLVFVKGARIFHSAADTRVEVLNLEGPMLRLTVLTASVRSIDSNAQQLLLFLSLLDRSSISRLTSSIHSLLRTYHLPLFYRGKPYHGSWQTRIKITYRRAVARNAQGSIAPGYALKESAAV